LTGSLAESVYQALNPLFMVRNSYIVRTSSDHAANYAVFCGKSREKKRWFLFTAFSEVLIGALASLTGPFAEAGISILAMSTYNTD